MNTVRWRLQKGHDRRFNSGHPWVYSNELQESPKGIAPGQVIELADAGGEFLAHGFGNPSSLIAFRTVSRLKTELDAVSAEGIRRRLSEALRLRIRLGLGSSSFRLCYAEADQCPGLIVDRYLTSTSGQVLVVQTQTAGMDRFVPDLVKILEAVVTTEWNTETWSRTSIVLRNDVGVRKLEGLTEELPRALRLASGMTEKTLSTSKILIRSGDGGDPIPFQCDLFEGQKTGFFLDQSANVELAIRRLGPLAAEQRTWKILDLCSYVSQWGTQMGRALKARGAQVEVLAVDASESSLEFARANLEAAGLKAKTLRADVLRDLGAIDTASFDLVISDPPALIKGRKDLGPGAHAYLSLNTQAMRVLKPGGAIISCSCSALYGEADFSGMLAKASRRAERPLRWIARGSQGVDHPELADFPEGRYLKASLGISNPA